MYLLRSWPTTIFLGLMFSSVALMASCGDKSNPLAGWGGWGGKAEGDDPPEAGDQTTEPLCQTDRSACAPIATGANLLQNSGFDEQREDNDWIAKPTANGDMGEFERPAVVSFDVNGDGQQSPSLAFRVGQKDFVEGTVNAEGVFIRGTAEGAVLHQEISVDEQGLLEVTVDVAAEMPVDEKFQGNKYGGIFELLVDGQVLATHDFGEIKNRILLRRTLTARTEVGPGFHEISLAIKRPMRNRASPIQYIDNFRAALAVEGPPVPSGEDVEGPPEPAPLEGPPEPPVDDTETPVEPLP